MIVSINESQTAEFKLIWKDEYLKTICAFANTDGGTLYLGVEDTGKVIGLDKIEHLIEVLPNKINNRLGLLVDVVICQQKSKHYLAITVNKTYAPISCSGKFYKRSGSNTIELNGSNLSNFLLNKYGKTWDEVAEDRFTIDEIDVDTIAKFKELACDRVPSIQQETSLESLLKKLNLYEGRYLKRAAVLLFGKDPQKYYIQSHSKIGRFLSETDVQTSDIISGNIINQVDNIFGCFKIEIFKVLYFL